MQARLRAVKSLIRAVCSFGGNNLQMGVKIFGSAARAGKRGPGEDAAHGDFLSWSGGMMAPTLRAKRALGRGTHFSMALEVKSNERSEDYVQICGNSVPHGK